MNTAVAGQPRIWSYEEICQQCRDAVEAMDNYRWLIGDTALELEAHYGEHTADDFARDIGCNGSTVRNWKRVAKFYQQPFRAEQIELNPNLTYTYFRDALRLGDDKNTVAEWLAYVSIHGWSADQAARNLTERLGHETRESIECEIVDTFWRTDGNHITIRLPKDLKLERGQKVTIKIKD